MKKPRYISILLITGILFLGSFSAKPGIEKKARQTGEAKPAKPSSESISRGNGWLNKKNFPLLQDHPCPFYVAPATGC